MESSTVAILMAAIFAIFTLVIFILGLAVSRIAPGSVRHREAGFFRAEPFREGIIWSRFTSFIGGSDVDSRINRRIMMILWT